MKDLLYALEVWQLYNSYAMLAYTQTHMYIIIKTFNNTYTFIIKTDFGSIKKNSKTFLK